MLSPYEERRTNFFGLVGCVQEWSPEASRSISRKERGGHSEENVVTLTNIVPSGGDDVPPSPITMDTGR